MRQHSHLAPLSILLANAAAIHTGYLLMAEATVSQQAGLLIWWCCTALTYGVLTVFLRRPRSIRGVILIAGAGLVLQILTVLLSGIRYPTALSWLIICTLWAAIYFRTCVFALHPAKAEQVIAAFEITVAVLLFTAFTVSGGITEHTALYPLAVSIVLSLLALARLRAAHPRVSEPISGRWKGRLLLVLLLLLLGGGTAGFIFLLTGSASELLTRFTRWLKAVGRRLFVLTERFFLWLVSFLPNSDMGEVELPETPGTHGFQNGSTEETLLDGSFLLYLLFGILLIGALLALLWLWRRGHSVRVAALSRPTGTISRRGPGPIASLILLWHRVCRWFVQRYRYLTQYNTPAGLLIWLERRAKRRRAARRPGETSRVFLLRLYPLLPGCEDELAQLADCLDTFYFAPSPCTSPLQIAALRRKFRKYITK